jgi:hypothetical protein
VNPPSIPGEIYSFESLSEVAMSALFIPVHCQNYAPLAAALDNAPAEKQSGNIALPYPGLPAQFVLKENTWDNPSPRADCRKIKFESTTNTSLIQDFFVIGNYDGSLQILVSFNEGYSEVDLENFLTSNGLALVITERTICVASNDKQVSDLFRIVFIHNTIPADMLDKVRGIVTQGKCQPLPQIVP